jgi:hypothetical protein
MPAKRGEKRHNEKSLTRMKGPAKMVLAGETEASNAEEQLARDSRLKATNCRWDGGLLPSHFTICKDNSAFCNA